MNDLSAAFEPDFENIVKAARNIAADRVPLYEHIVSVSIVEKITGENFAGLCRSDDQKDLVEFFGHYCNFFTAMGYDAVCWEGCIGDIMPGSGALGSHEQGAIKSRAELDDYPWETIEQAYFKKYSGQFEALRKAMPAGMKAIGGVGNGVFECVQEIVGYENLCLMRGDDPELYADIFRLVGQISANIWARFLREFGDVYCVCRFGDDLGFKSSTLLCPDDIRKHILPHYKQIVKLVHSFDKPFLLHSCGCIFDVMEYLIDDIGIDAKHSNEDIIAPFEAWVDRYGERIGNFGGIDVDLLCNGSTDQIRRRVFELIEHTQGRGGIAIGTGNSIPDYVPVEKYVAMINAVRECRGD